MNLAEYASRVPDYKAFLTVEEMDASTLRLAEKHPDIVKVFKAGESQEGRPLLCLKIGSGPKNALIFGCPHPNEPIGAMMLEAFSAMLAEDEALLHSLGYTFYMIKAVDPDGLKRNEGWLKGPFSYYNYARHFYRPASAQQVEWTFPLDYKTLHFHTPLPETRALMKIIEETKPEFLYSLHNSAFGGVFWYVNEGIPYLVEHLKDIPKRYGIPLNLGEPEMPCCQVYESAVFQFPGVPMIYDFYEQMTGQDPAPILNSGSSSVDFANLNGRKCFGIVCEMPYFRNADSADVSPTDMIRRDAVMQSCDRIEALYKELLPLMEVLRAHVPPENAYRAALEERFAIYGQSLAAQRNFARQNPEFDQPATRAQAFDNLVMMPFMHLLGVGMAAAAAQEAMAKAAPQDKPELAAVIEKAEAMLREGCAATEALIPCDPIDIRTLVSVQLESGLMAAMALRETL